MPRKARKQSPTDFYHIMLRGINKERIFELDKYKELFIKIITQGIEETDVKIGAYCIMDNHVHIVAKSELDELSKFFKKINIKFAMRYNKNHDRVGHVFQDRYKSEVILNDSHLAQVIRYVHKNPINAGIVSNIKKYKWSSYKEYISEVDPIVSTEIKSLVLDIVGGKKGVEKFHSQEETVLFLDTDEEVEKMKEKISNNIVKNYCKDKGVMEVSQIKNNQESLEGLIKELLKEEQFTHREIAEKLEINRNLVHIINKNKGQ